MRLKQTTDYAIRCVFYLSQKRSFEYATAEEVGMALNVSVPYMRKILMDLRNKGIVESFQGVKGGYQMKKNPKNISMFELVNAEEQTMKIDGCFEAKQISSGTGCASLEQYFKKLQGMVEHYLKNTTVYDLIKEQS